MLVNVCWIVLHFRIKVFNDAVENKNSFSSYSSKTKLKCCAGLNIGLHVDA